MGTINMGGKRFVIVPEEEYERMASVTRELTEAQGPALPTPDAHGNVPAAAYMRAGLARRIIHRRRQAGLSQKELARLAGVRVETLCRIEKGKINPTTLTFEKITRALDKARREAACE
jgi:DNA-binding XRE family transcriptional regulator